MSFGGGPGYPWTQRMYSAQDATVMEAETAAEVGVGDEPVDHAVFGDVSVGKPMVSV